MSEIFMISLSVDLKELRRLGAVRGFAADEGRMLHHALGETFGPGILQPFRLMAAQGGANRSASLYAYATAGEAELQQTAREVAQPEMLRLFDLDGLRVKAMPTVWTEGRNLGFDLRVRPVRRLLRPMDSVEAGKPLPKGAEVDVYLLDRARNGPIADDDTALAVREYRYIQWLQERLKGATLDLERTRLAGFERVRTLRGPKGDIRLCEAPDAVIQGELTVIDGKVFQAQLACGVGRHKAYGYGMLLLRPARG